MNILLVPLFKNIYLYEKIAVKMENEGHNVYWITTSQKWKEWLIKKNIKEEQILLLERHYKQNTKINLNGLCEIEAHTGDSIKDLVLMDRIIRNWSWEEVLCYANSVSQLVKEFVIDNKLDVCFIEGTVLHELLINSICDYYSIPVYSMATIRIPSERLAFFKGIYQSEIELINFNKVDTNQIEEVIKGVNNGVKPNYFYWNNIVPKMDNKYFKSVYQKFIEALIYSKRDATIKSIEYHLFNETKYLKPIKYATVKKIFENPNFDEDYVLYTLHHQPERSIDVLGSNVSNQYELIKNIVRNLPVNVKLYVKEHSNSLGIRSRKDLLSIKKLPGVRLIDPNYNTNELVRKSRLVITVSGTVAFEAALQGKKAVVFAPMYFRHLENVYYIEKIPTIKSVLEEKDKCLGENDKEFIGEILKHSFPGEIAGPNYLNDLNIANITNGFLKLLQHIENK
jgi:hypothetical protein